MKDQSSGSRKTPSTNDDAGTLTPGFGGLSWPEVKQQEALHWVKEIDAIPPEKPGHAPT